MSKNCTHMLQSSFSYALAESMSTLFLQNSSHNLWYVNSLKIYSQRRQIWFSFYTRFTKRPVMNCSNAYVNGICRIDKFSINEFESWSKMIRNSSPLLKFLRDFSNFCILFLIIPAKANGANLFLINPSRKNRLEI